VSFASRRSRRHSTGDVTSNTVNRRLLRPSFLALCLAVLLLAGLFVRLGVWQLHRLHERKDANAITTGNLGASPAPAADVLAPGRDVSKSQSWRSIEATGHYDSSHELVVRNRTFQSMPGYEVITPLVTGDGKAILVDRGWVPLSATTTTKPDVPAAPTGEVTIVAYALPSEHDRAGTTGGPTWQVPRIDVAKIAATLPYPVYGGYAQLVSQTPPVGSSPAVLPTPDLGEGPHLGYAVQWFSFAAIGVIGLLIFGRLQVKPRTPKRSEDDTEDDEDFPEEISDVEAERP
jgi:cytochrome oxidase assembly protein ShyY1